MADQPVETVAPAAEPTPTLPETDNRNPELKESALPPPQPLFATPPPNQGLNPSTPPPPPPPPTLLFPPPSIHPYPAAPSFRPATPSQPQFAPLPVPSNPNLPQPPSYSTSGPVPLNPNLPQPPSYSTSGGLPPPGVNAVPTAPLGAAGQVPMQSSMPLSIPPPYAPLRPPYAQLPNGYSAIPHTSLPGIARFPPQYALLRPPYPRPGTVFMPPFSRPPVPMIRPAILPPMVRPLPVVTIPEKLQITVYIGKISPTVENDFMLSLLQLCGPVKSWKRPQDPTNGTLKSFGLYEFETPEGVLRALRLLSKLSIDGQELMVNVNKAARDYLERYIAKKLESYKTLKEADAESTKKDDEDALGDKKNGTANSSAESPNPPTETSIKDDSSTAKSESSDVDFGLVSDEDRQADQEALEKIKGMIEERLKNKPLPPPPAHTTAVGSTSSQMDVPARSKDGEEVDIDVTKDAAEDKNDNEMSTDSKPAGDQDRSEIISPDRKHDKRRDRERDVKREKERELERYEREREQDRAKREKDREYRIREDERRYKAREKEWEVREKEKEHWRKREKEREKDRAHERKLEVVAQERESQDGYSKKRKYKSSDDERRKRQREKEEDMDDRLKEEEEIVEAKRRAEEELQKRQEGEEEELKHLSEHPVDENEVAVLSSDLSNTANKDIPVEQMPEMGVSYHVGDEIMQNGVGDESSVASLPNAEARHNANASSRKLGFGLLGVGKRTSVPSVFNQDEDEDAHKEKKMRPLVPIDYSTEEHLQPSASEAPSSNLAAAAEFAKHISGAVPKEERYDTEKERNKRSNDRHGQRDKDRNTNESSRSRDEIKKENHSRDRDRGHGLDKAKTPDNQKLLDAKQLIDMIPKTKDELFSYEINWETYDRNSLQERMKPWISKKITEFLGEEEATLVDYIVSSTREHVKATEMLDRLQGILDEEAEMFVLKMWRMLIFEIKRVETGLALRSR